MQISLNATHVPFEYMYLELEINRTVEQDILSTTQLTTDSYDKKFVLFGFPS